MKKLSAELRRMSLPSQRKIYSVIQNNALAQQQTTAILLLPVSHVTLGPEDCVKGCVDKELKSGRGYMLVRSLRLRCPSHE